MNHYLTSIISLKSERKGTFSPLILQLSVRKYFRLTRCSSCFKNSLDQLTYEYTDYQTYEVSGPERD